jgi:hypothetical protein
MSLAQPAAEWAGAPQLRADMDRMGLPAPLLRQVDFRAAPPWGDPSRSGCCPSCGHGTARIIGPFRLLEWAAAGVLGAVDVTAAADLDATAERLRTAGEGCRVLWHLELIDERWLGLPDPMFSPESLVVVGPHLTAATIAEIDDRLAAMPGGSWDRHNAFRPDLQTTNATARVGRVDCWFTSWTAFIGPARW